MTNRLISTLFASLLVALTAAGLIVLVRQIPWVDAQMMASKKPWVCNLCMSFWMTALVSGINSYAFGYPWVLPYAFTLTLLIVNALGAPQSSPDFLKDIPEMKDEP